jgi:ribosome-associated translation inhibitor RaiA
MQVKVNTSGLPNREALDRWVEQHLQEELARFRQDITRVDLHLSEEGAAKAGGLQRCTLDARLVQFQPIAVHHDADNHDLAIRGATDKLKRAVESTVQRGRDNDHRERDSIRKSGAADTGAATE